LLQEGKKSPMTHLAVNSELERLVSNGTAAAPLGRPFSELADHRKSTALQCSRIQRKTQLGTMGWEPKDQYKLHQGKDIAYDSSRVHRHWKVSNGTTTSPGKTVERACRLSKIHGTAHPKGYGEIES
jgi:hypothetical protein